MSENKEFPDLRQMWLDGDIDSAIGDADDWFKRCMEDSPIYETKYGLWEEWYSKWFSQFRNNKE